MMSRKQKILSSHEAASNFKKSIDKSLNLLGLLNNADKKDVWKYWKAVSSAVKIALCGKGDIIVSPPGSPGGIACKNTDELEYITTVRILLSHSDKRQRRLRILGFDDHQVTDDYVEVTDRAFSYNRYAKSKIEDASHLRPLPADLVSQICQLGEYSANVETSLSATESENCNSGDGTSPALVNTANNPTICVLSNEQLVEEMTDATAMTMTSENPVNRFSLRVKESNAAKTHGPVHVKEIKVGLKKSSVSKVLENSKDGNEDCQSDSISCEESNGGCVEPQSTVFSLNVDGSLDNNATSNDSVNNFCSVVKTEFSAQTVYPEGNETETATSVLVRSEAFDEQPYDGKAPPSDIEAIISALEEELKKTGSSSGIHSISITSSGDGSATMDVHTASKDDSDLQGQEVVVVQNVGDVVWTPSTAETTEVVNTTHVDPVTSAVVSAEIGDDVSVHSSIDAQYDVVEYEVHAENNKARRSLGGRKRKYEGLEVPSATKSKDTLDRTCPMCHRVLTYPSSMAAHMRTHTGDRPYSCGQCDRKFTTKANRDRHEATHEGLKPFKCLECEKCFTEKRSLTIHMRSHTGERPYVCPVCHQGFAQKCTMTVHMDRHTNKKGHLCDLCGKAFRQKSQLDVHVKRHNRQANYPCPECSIRCYTKGDLDRHMIKHTGARPFSCSLCSKTFTRKQYLMDHENSHLGRKPYKCSVCHVAFHDMGSCHRHVKKHREEDSQKGVRYEPATVLTAEDYNSILKESEAGKILTLEDGTQAMVTAVDTEADGCIVYHMTCVHGQQGDKDGEATIDSSVEGMMDVTVSTMGGDNKEIEYVPDNTIS